MLCFSVKTFSHICIWSRASIVLSLFLIFGQIWASLFWLIKLFLKKKREVYIALNELIRNSMQHAKEEWQPKTPPWVFTSAARFYFRREISLPPRVFNFRRACLTSAASFSFLPWAFLFCRELFFYTVSFSFLPWAFLFYRELFSFAVSFSFLPWAFLFCRELFSFAVSFSFLPWAFLFCRELFSFSVSFSFLPWAFLFCRELSLFPWHLWATVRVDL